MKEGRKERRKEKDGKRLKNRRKQKEMWEERR